MRKASSRLGTQKIKLCSFWLGEVAEKHINPQMRELQTVISAKEEEQQGH